MSLNLRGTVIIQIRISLNPNLKVTFSIIISLLIISTYKKYFYEIKIFMISILSPAIHQFTYYFRNSVNHFFLFSQFI